MPGDFDWDAVKKLLEANVNESYIKTRPQGGANISYIEGWRAIAEANRIFGNGGWSCQTISYAEASREKIKNAKGFEQYKVSYTAHVRVTAGGVTRDGLGYGSGFASLNQGVAGAIEKAVKQAETDATKRALKSFGWRFGLALYDKSRAHVSDAPQSYQDSPPPRELPPPQPQIAQAEPKPERPSLSDTIATLKYQSVDDARKALEPYRHLASGATSVCGIMELIETKPDADEIQAAMLGNGMGRLMKSLKNNHPEAHDAMRAYSLLSYREAKEADAEIERKHLEMDNAAKVAA